MGRGSNQKGHLKLVHSVVVPEETPEQQRRERIKKKLKDIHNTYTITIRQTHYKNPSKRFRAVNAEPLFKSAFARSKDEAIQKMESQLIAYHVKKAKKTDAPIFHIKDETNFPADFNVLEAYTELEGPERRRILRGQLNDHRATFEVLVEEDSGLFHNAVARIRNSSLRNFGEKVIKADSKINAEVKARNFIYDFQDKNAKSYRPVIKKVEKFSS